MDHLAPDLGPPEKLTIEQCICLAAAVVNGGVISPGRVLELCNAPATSAPTVTRDLKVLALKGLIEKTDNLDLACSGQAYVLARP